MSGFIGEIRERLYRRLLGAQMYFAHYAIERALEKLEEGLVISAETGEEYWTPPLSLQKLHCLEPSGERQLVASGYRLLLNLAITGRAREWALQALNGLVRVEGCDSSARNTCESIFEQHEGRSRAFSEAQGWFVV